MDTGRNKQIPGPGSNPAGRVVIDSRGRNVWQWNDDQLDSTSIVLKRLDNSALALEPTRQVRGLKSSNAAQKSSSDGTSSELRIEQTFKVKLGGGFDPYNRS
ncbi:MAG TPA: hypothetical protein VMR74_03890 [Gammaproteobacteria bacterium]|nr:hypothetical protein [Gammaproteobacteria bacterium]